MMVYSIDAGWEQRSNSQLRQRIYIAGMTAIVLAASGIVHAQTPPPAPTPPLIMPGPEYMTPKPVKEVRAPTMAAIGQTLAPLPDARPPDPAVTKALDILKKNHMTGAVAHVAATPQLIEKLGKALMLGDNARKYVPELAKLNDALLKGDGAARAAVLDIWRKVGRKPPNDKDLDKLVSDARDAAAGALPPAQHGTIKDADGNVIEIDSAPSAGLARVSVTVPGKDGKPTRVTFTGRRQSKPNAAGNNIDSSLVPDAPDVTTTDDSAEQRKHVNGKWIDQDGNTWEISGEGDDITFTQTSLKTGHKTVYTGKWDLGQPNAVHLVNDVNDMDDGLPGDVKSQLADTFHPPFTLRLKYKSDEEEFDGLWISGQVTYSGMDHTVSVVDDPTWDKPLTLTHDIIPEALLFVKAEPAPILVDKFYKGVPLMVGLKFEKPYAQSSYPVKIKAGSTTISLTATPANADNTLFETEAFEVGKE